MIIESANLSPLAPGTSTVESMLPPSIDGATSGGFSGALVAQIELLNNITNDGSLPPQTPDIKVLQDVNGSQSVVSALSTSNDVQEFATLLGNNLPLSYKTKDDIDHEAALAAVTDSLKYISTGTTAGEKAAVAEQNMKDVIAMVVPAEQNRTDVLTTAVSAEQDMKSVISMAVPAGQNMVNAVATAVSVEQNMIGVVSTAVPAGQSMVNAVVTNVPVGQNAKNAVTLTVPVEQSTTDVIAESGQSAKDSAMETPVQTDLGQGNDKADKKQVEDNAQIDLAQNSSGTEELVAATIMPLPVIPSEQAKIANNLTSADVVKDSGLLSFTKPLIDAGKPNQPMEVADNILQAETAFSQSVKDKQGFNLNSFQDLGQTEKTMRADQQVLGLEGDRALAKAGVDVAQLNRTVDNKTDVPAITKPLSHPEWNKDLGDRIVWMSNKAVPSAEIRLNPQHLGPISVRVDVADDQATVVFTAQHAAVRETLEASIPKLREMMGAQQLNLVDVSVSQGPASDQGRSQSQNFAQTADSRSQGAISAVDEINDVEQEIASGRAVVSNGLLSIYA
ncbi:MAG: flagellar hook-length control protein FliK [Methylobacter sp.]